MTSWRTRAGGGHVPDDDELREMLDDALVDDDESSLLDDEVEQANAALRRARARLAGLNPRRLVVITFVAGLGLLAAGSLVVGLFLGLGLRFAGVCW